MYLLNIFANAVPKSKQKNIKNYSLILAILNYRNWLDDSPPLNCRGDAGGRVPHRELAYPHRNLASPHRDLGVPSSRFERWINRQKRFNSSPNFGEIPLQFLAMTFFLLFIQFRRRNYVIFTKVLSHAKCVWSRLQKRPLMQNFAI